MTSDHRRHQIDKGSFGGSRDRWRPPDQKRERGPAGDRTADLKNTNISDDRPVNNTPILVPQSRQRVLLQEAPKSQASTDRQASDASRPRSPGARRRQAASSVVGAAMPDDSVADLWAGPVP